jgi:hypothetical protein
LQQFDSTRFPSDTVHHDFKRDYSVLDDNLGMRAVKAYYDDQRRVRAAAVERDIAREREDEDEDKYFVRGFLAEDKKNQTLIDQ